LKLPVPFFKSQPERTRVVLRPDPVFIIGMHRSGTSALGGVLESLGLTVGKSVMPPRPDNPKGFYENLALTELHDKFLKSIGSSWDDSIPVVERHFQGEAASRFQSKLLPLLIEEYGEGRPLIKDPRICRLMPLWVPLIKEHFTEARFILPIRHPVAVAHSLVQRGELTIDDSLKLWVVHVIEAERSSRDFPRAFTTYDALMQCPVETMLGLARSAGLPENGVAAAVSKQIDSTLQHHTKSSWPEGAPDEALILAIHQALLSDESGKREELDGLRNEYYGQMGWPC
jgi:hypothetical protein